MDPRLQRHKFRHDMNGGCSTFKIHIGFVNLAKPCDLPNIERVLGDFITYSCQPSQAIAFEKIDPKFHLVKDAKISMKKLKNKLALPTHLFSTGWGLRELLPSEIFNIWGLPDLDNKLDLEFLLRIVPTQVASAILCSYFTLRPSSNYKKSNDKKQVRFKLDNDITSFETIGKSITHEWIDDNIILSSSY